MAISGRTESAMLRSMCAVKLVDRKNNEELMKMLGLEEILDKMAKIKEYCGMDKWLGEMMITF